MILTGAGDAFCSGADLGDPSDVAGRPGDPYLVQLRALGDVALRLHRIPKPTIAKVGGVAAGAGMSMALGCDLVVASDTARFSQIFSKRGLSVDFGASWLLPRLIGLHRAKELAFFADIIDAQPGSGIRPGQPHRPRRQVGCVRFGLGDTAGRRPPVGPVHDQDHVEQLPQHLDGSGPRGGVPFPGGQFRQRGHPGGTPGIQPEARATVRGSLSSGITELRGRWVRGRAVRGSLGSGGPGLRGRWVRGGPGFGRRGRDGEPTRVRVCLAPAVWRV